MYAVFMHATLSAGLLLVASSPASSFPDESSTGPKKGAVLKPFSGTLVVTKESTVIDGLDIRGEVVIEARNVTIQNSRIVAGQSPQAIHVMDDIDGFVLQDSEIEGRGEVVNAVVGRGTFLRNNIHGVENGLNVDGPSLIQGNFIHDMRGSAEAHFDGIEVNGGHDIKILQNTVLNENGQTSAVMLNNYFRGLADITIDGNRLAGGGYTVYLDDRFGGGAVDIGSIRVTRNLLIRGQWGFFAFYGNSPVQSGNIFEPAEEQPSAE